MTVPNSRQRAPTPVKREAASARSPSTCRTPAGATASPPPASARLAGSSARLPARRRVRMVSAGVETAPPTTPAMAPAASETK
eukprot:scaffold22056_cov113-Isochrysis_galbana.AAC.10